MIIKFYNSHKKFFIYCLIGACGASLDFFVFIFLAEFLKINYQLANFISILLGIGTNFFLNLKFNFKVEDKMLKRFISFYLIGLIGIILSGSMLYLFITILAMPKSPAKLITIVVIAFVQYYLNSRISFKKSITELCQK